MKYFNLFSTIFITKGANRILVSDLQRNTSELYPMELYELIEELKTHPIENILSNYDHESQEIVEEYVDLLLEKEYGFITENGWDHNFSPLSYEYRDYSTISNIFIELGNVDILHKLKNSIENLGIRHLVIFSTSKFSFDEFLKIDQLFTNTPLENIEIFSPHHHQLDHHSLEELSDKVSRIHSLVLYNAACSSFKVNNTLRFTVDFIKQDLKITSCGIVDMKYFNTNISKVLEAMNHNSCLHKKMGIDINGNIKNCPLMPEIYGNIYHQSLEEVLKKSEFKKYWDLTKEGIETCKDCEFRNICTDCRAYTEQTHINRDGLDISKPLKCGYNPYSTEWEEWAQNPLKSKAIQQYRELEKKNS